MAETCPVCKGSGVKPEEFKCPCGKEGTAKYTFTFCSEHGRVMDAAKEYVRKKGGTLE